MKNKKQTKKSTVKKNSKTVYQKVSKNIYDTGTSYRVRVSIKGETVSINAPTKKEAFRVRKQLLELRTNS
jgi:hypothetical protein